MGLKKTWYGYLNAILGILFAGSFSFLILFEGDEIFESVRGLFSFGIEESLYKILFISVLMLACIGILLGFSFIKKNIVFNDPSKGVVANFLSVMIFAGFICFFLFQKYNDIFTVSSVEREALFVSRDLDIVKEAFLGESFKIASFGDIYYFLQGFLLRLFGEDFIVLPLFNAFLIVLSEVFIFFSLRRTFGFIETLAVIIASYFLIPGLFDTYNLNGAIFYLFAFSFVLLIVFSILSSIGAEGEQAEKTSLKTGYLLGFDLTVLIMLILGICAACFFFFEKGVLKLSLDSFDIKNVFYRGEVNEYIFLSLLLLSLISFISFFFEKEDHVSALTLPLLVAAMILAVNDYATYFVNIEIALLLLLAGTGISAFFFRGYKESSVNFSEYENAVLFAEDDAAADNTILDDMEENGDEEPVSILDELSGDESKIVYVSEEKPEASTTGDGSIQAVPAEKEDSSVKEDPMVNEESSAKEEPEIKNVELIENPLPVPKPHVKRSVDYGFEPDEAYMKFDIEIPDDDDFDI